MTLEELGRKFVLLGRALQSEDATLDELVGLALACGLQLQFKIVPMKQEDANDLHA